MHKPKHTHLLENKTVRWITTNNTFYNILTLIKVVVARDNTIYNIDRYIFRTIIIGMEILGMQETFNRNIIQYV